MAWLWESIDGESAIRQINSWEDLNNIADQNKVERSAIEFAEGAVKDCDIGWGVNPEL